MNWTNADAAHRHAFHALEDLMLIYDRLRDAGFDREVHAIGHHLRHAVYRTGLEAQPKYRRHVGRNPPIGK